MNKSNIPITKHINDFLDWIDVEKGLSSKTQENYRRFLEKFLVWLKKNNLENILPHQLNQDHIWDYRVYLARYSPTSGSKSLKKVTQKLLFNRFKSPFRLLCGKRHSFATP